MSACDILAIGAHPDDADLGVGGQLLRAAEQGYSTAILDLTRGELGTRGTTEDRAKEAEYAGKLLRLTQRRNADLPDGALADTQAQRLVVAAHIRALRPRVLLAPMAPDRHPDHDAAHALVRAANFMAGLEKLPCEGQPHRAPHIYFDHPYAAGAATPALVVDITQQFDAKLEALRAFASQFHRPGAEGTPTYVSSEAFWEQISVRAAYWGNQIGARYGEPLYAAAPIRMNLPPGLDEANA